MAEEFAAHWAGELAALEDSGLRRRLRNVEEVDGVRLRLDGRDCINFASNDYLGLAQHAALREAAVKAAENFGAGSGSARLISGSAEVHGELESALARFKQAEAALVFSSGYAAALGTIPALVGSGDVVVVDKLAHASLVDAARLSRAKLRVFRHNDMGDLESILERATGREGRTLIVAESVYSMDGDLGPVRELVALKERHGAWLMLDEAHATGLFGEGRRGLVEEFGVSDQVEVQMGTLGKALGVAGGFVCGSRELVDWLVNRARSFMFSTASVPAQSAAARAAVGLIESDEGEALRAQLWSLVDHLKNGLIQRGWKLPVVRSPIVPIVVGDEDAAVALSARLLDAGVFVPAIRFPTVARGQARLRLTVSAAHTPEDVDTLLEALGDA